MTQTNLQFADHICKRMLANGMVKSQAEFSKTWLDQSPSYLSSSKTRHRNIPDTTIKHLFNCLDVRLQICRSNMAGGNVSAHWRQAYEKAFPIHAEVQSFLTWQASGQAIARLSPNQITNIVQRISQGAAQLHAKTSPLSNLIKLPTHRKSL